MRTMNRLRFLVLLLALFPLVESWAQVAGSPSAFLDVEPLGARVQLDGVLIPETAPLLFRSLKPGRHTVSLWKEGYAQVTRTFDVVDGAVPTVEVDLPPASVVLAFPENPQVDDPNGALAAPGNLFRYPSGTYEFNDRGGVLKVTPRFQDEGLLAVAGWSLTLVTAAALASTTSDLWHIKTGWADHPSTLTMSLWSVSFLELPWYLSIQGRKDRFEKETAPKLAADPGRLDAAPTLYAQASDALQAGDLARAETMLARFIREFPLSRLTPGAWFQLAKVHTVTGKRDLALGEYRLVAEVWPQPTYHDRARQAMADLYEAQGDIDRALANLDSMVLADGFFDKDAVDSQRERLIAAQGAKDAP